jgi:indole-3-glycerol phosphate synthase
VLDAIVAGARRSALVREAEVPPSTLLARAARAAPRAAAFRAGLARSNARNVIAECKRRSPSRGVLKREYDPVALARTYERGGAVAISILTEPSFFDGDPAHLQAVRQATALPLLQKDFIVSDYQLLEARANGADAVLLIAAALADRQLKALLARAGELELAALVEVHDEIELLRALEAGAAIIGVNNRDLRTLAVDGAATRDLIDRIPDETVAVAESGLQSVQDVERLQRAGYDAFLIGEWLMTSADPHAVLRSLRMRNAERGMRNDAPNEGGEG